MTELMSSDAYQEDLGGLTSREIYEGQTPEYLRAEKQRLLGSMGLLAYKVQEINDVLHGVTGVHEVEEYLG